MEKMPYTCTTRVDAQYNSTCQQLKVSSKALDVRQVHTYISKVIVVTILFTPPPGVHSPWRACGVLPRRLSFIQHPHTSHTPPLPRTLFFLQASLKIPTSGPSRVVVRSCHLFVD